jgi:hypothetical protein
MTVARDGVARDRTGARHSPVRGRWIARTIACRKGRVPQPASSALLRGQERERGGNIRLADYGLAVGKAADLVVLHAVEPEMAIAEIVPVLYAFKCGRMTVCRERKAQSATMTFNVPLNALCPHTHVAPTGTEVLSTIMADTPSIGSCCD